MVSCLAYSSILKIEAMCSFETSVKFQRTTRLYISEVSALQYIFISVNINYYYYNYNYNYYYYYYYYYYN
jgi:hypothetical protein